MTKTNKQRKIISKVRELKTKLGNVQKIVTIPKMEETKKWVADDLVEIKKVKVIYKGEK